MNTMKKKIKIVIAIILFLLLFGLAGTMDYNDKFEENDTIEVKY